MASLIGGGVLGSRAGVRVLGLPEAVAKLRGVDSVVRLELGLTMARAAKFMQATAQSLAPYETGNLKSGIKTNKMGPYEHDVTASSLDGTNDEKNGKEYAGFVENGTSVMEGSYFMTRAFDHTVPIVQAEIYALARKIELL